MKLLIMCFLLQVSAVLCFGLEHGDPVATQLFGIGYDHQQRLEEEERLQSFTIAQRQVHLFETKLDHFNSSEARTFNLRYWVDNQFFDEKNASNPIFLYICGEWTCSPHGYKSLSAFSLGAKVNASLYSLEHRYYGESQPFTSEEGGWSYDNLKWLNATQALEDIAAFIDAKNDEISARGGPKHQWVIIGGSYPGMLAAWFRSKYPEHATVAWASSAVHNVQKEFINYDLGLLLGTQSSSWKCSQRFHEGIEAIRKAFEWKHDPLLSESFGVSYKSSLLSRFRLYEDYTPGEVLYYISSNLAAAVQYGHRIDLCKFLESDEYGEDPVGTLAKELRGSFSIIKKSRMYDTKVVPSSMLRQWTYQVCTEFGFFIMPNNIYSQVSSLLNSTFWKEHCEAVFTKEIPEPKAEWYNEKYGGLNITGSNIYFFTASEDPWRFAGMTELQDPNNTQKEMRATYIECPTCGHCVDLKMPGASTPTVVKQAVARGWKQIKQWLAADLAKRNPTTGEYAASSLASSSFEADELIQS